jgi:transposase InsO family protein
MTQRRRRPDRPQAGLRNELPGRHSRSLADAISIGPPHEIGPERNAIATGTRLHLAPHTDFRDRLYSQYVSIRYTEHLAKAGIEPSVSSVGDSYDNALAETINGLCKAEVIHRRGRWRSFETVEFAALEWVDWFNDRRVLEPIGNIPPTEAEERYYTMLEHPAMAA